MMHKKDIVKEVIDKYIRQGMDFFELTPSYLVTLNELKGFSERTLKRGRTEYKKEHKDILKGKSKAAVNLRKKVFGTLENNPNISLEQLQKKIAGADKKQIADNLKLWKQEQSGQTNPKPKKTKPAKDVSGSLRQKVFNHLEENPKATLSKLEKAFTSDNKKTISNYLDQWRKERTNREKRISTKQKISNYLDKHPTSTLKDLKKAFSDINPSSIGAYHSLWKNKQAGLLDEYNQKKTPSTTTTVTKKAKIDSENLTDDSAMQIITALNNTVDAQKKTIDILKAQNSELQKKQEYVFPELKGMSKNEIDKFERVMATFLKGLRKS